MTQLTRRGRPGILDLIALTIGCGLALAAYRGILPDWFRIMPAEWRTRALGYLIGMSAAFGLLFAGNLALVRRRRRGDEAGVRLPGHWLLILGGLAVWADLMGLVVLFARAITGPEPDSDPATFRVFATLTEYPYFPGLVHQVVGWGLGGVFALGCSCYAWPRVPTAWGLTFFAMAGCALLFGGAALAAIFELWELERPCHVVAFYQSRGIATYRAAMLACLALLWVAVVRERRPDRPDDWPHRAGIAAWTLIAATQAAACR